MNMKKYLKIILFSIPVIAGVIFLQKKLDISNNTVCWTFITTGLPIIWVLLEGMPNLSWLNSKSSGVPRKFIFMRILGVFVMYLGAILAITHFIHLLDISLLPGVLTAVAGTLIHQFGKSLGEMARDRTRGNTQEEFLPNSGVYPVSPTQTDTTVSPATAVLMQIIEEKRKSDPLIGAKLGAKEICQRLTEAMKDTKGVHIESILCALGSLAGYACQANVRAKAMEKGLPETAVFVIVNTTGDKKFYFGDELNAALAQSKYSIWGLAAGVAQKNGCEKLPDIESIFKHTAGAIGDAGFGIPRLPENHRPGDLPINYLKTLWPVLFPVARQFCKRSTEWPILFGLAIQEILETGKDVIPSDMALLIVMESAIPMSKVDLSAA